MKEVVNPGRHEPDVLDCANATSEGGNDVE